jgi:hypothetical protein
MKVSNEMNQASKITLVFIAVTSAFALLGKLSAFFPLGNYNFEYFVKYNMVWFIVVILLILGLCFYIKKVDGEFKLIFLHNPAVMVIAGLLIICEGIINLSGRIYSLLLNIQTFHQTAPTFGVNADEIIRGALTSNGIQILAYLLQVLFGLFIILHQSKNKEIVE